MVRLIDGQMVIYKMYSWTNGQMDRQIAKMTDRQIARLTDRLTNVQVDRSMDRPKAWRRQSRLPDKQTPLRHKVHTFQSPPKYSRQKYSRPKTER
jgi:hypothetical protein